MERIVMRIRQLRAFGLSLREIHDRVVGDDCDEEMFFLCYQGAQILARREQESVVS